MEGERESKVFDFVLIGLWPDWVGTQVAGMWRALALSGWHLGLQLPCSVDLCIWKVFKCPDWPSGWECDRPWVVWHRLHLQDQRQPRCLPYLGSSPYIVLCMCWFNYRLNICREDAVKIGDFRKAPRVVWSTRLLINFHENMFNVISLWFELCWLKILKQFNIYNCDKQDNSGPQLYLFHHYYRSILNLKLCLWLKVRLIDALIIVTL